MDFARRGALWLGLGLIATLAVGPGVAQGNCAQPGNAAALAAQVVAAVNANRKANGRGALGRSDLLDEAALGHACWMGRTGTFSHKGQGGSTPKRRIKATGYKTRLTAENIAFGQTSGTQVVADWMDSSGHRKNILRGGIDEIGIGVAIMQGRPVWVATFAAK